MKRNIVAPWETNNSTVPDMGFKAMPVRFFVIDLDDLEPKEVTEKDFLYAEGVIEYERHTMFENGVNQVCLTKNPF